MRRGLLLVALAAAGSQAGHLIAYAVRFGAAAQQVQSTGAHGYFPVAAKTILGLAAIGLLLALFIVAWARVLTKGAGRRVATGPSFIVLFAVLFTIQLTFFIAQEVAEASAAGVRADSVSGLALWGMLGQLPAAGVGAAILRWLWSRVEVAIGQLRAAVAALRWFDPAAPLAPVTLRSHDHVRWTAPRTPLSRRGPPHSA